MNIKTHQELDLITQYIDQALDLITDDRLTVIDRETIVDLLNNSRTRINGLQITAAAAELGLGEVIRQETWGGLGKMTYTLIDADFLSNKYIIEQKFYPLDESIDAEVFDRYVTDYTGVLACKNDANYDPMPGDRTPSPSIPDLMTDVPMPPVPAQPKTKTLALFGASGEL